MTAMSIQQMNTDGSVFPDRVLASGPWPLAISRS